MNGGLPREIETKFRVDDRVALEMRLERLGAKNRGTETESNVLFDDAKESLRGRGSALRLRTTASGALLTFKGKADVAAGIKSRVELESEVEKPERVAQILEELGFRPWFRYEKHRTSWRFDAPGRPLVVVDDTPIGLFAEIEGDADGVRALAKELGVPESALIAESYIALYLAERKRNPALPKDMVFE